MSGLTPLLLIHGWGFGPAVWSPLSACLPAGISVIAPPQSGYGDAGAVVSRQEPIHELETQLQRLDQPAVIAGWSLGGLLALQLAQAWPEQVRALVLIASLPRFRRGPEWPAGIDSAGLMAVRQRLQDKPDGAVAYVAALSARGDDASRKVRQVLNQAVPNPSNVAVLARDLDYLEQADLRASQPATLHVILGQRDQVIGADCAETLQAWCPHAHLHVVAGAGHAPMISRPEAVAGVLVGFM